MSEKSTEPSGPFHWNLDKLADALKISKNDVKEYFTDGRRISFILERRLAREVMTGSIATSEGAGYDLIDSHKHKWEVRSISKDGVYFSPSYMVGSGRSFDKTGFLDKLSKIAGFILSDIVSFPDVPFWIVSTSEVRAWWDSGTLGKNAAISREKVLALLSGQQK